jgi:hypothetical protein
VFVQVAGIDSYRHSFDFWRQMLVVMYSVGAVSWNLWTEPPGPRFPTRPDGGRRAGVNGSPPSAVHVDAQVTTRTSTSRKSRCAPTTGYSTTNPRPADLNVPDNRQRLTACVR